MKSATILVVMAALIILATFNGVFGQSTQGSYTVRLNSFSLQVTYPAVVMPGDNVTIYVQGSPTGSAVYLQSLTVTVYYADGAGLHQVSTQNLFAISPPNAYNNYVSYSYAGSFSKNFTVNIPVNASGTLVSLFSETALPKYQGWTPYFPSYPYSSSYPYNPYSPSMPSYPYSSSYPSYPYYQYYPSSPYLYPYSNSYSSDQAIAPLSYIKANAPESVTLQSENQLLQQQLNQSQGQNQELQSKVSQQSATINQLSQQLAGANGTAQTFQTLTQMLGLALGGLAVVLLAVIINQRRRTQKQRPVETKASI